MLRALEAGKNLKAVSEELRDKLHRQGDVGESSYACVPHLVRLYRQKKQLDWNTYAIVGVIDLARTENNNPELPGWLKKSYHNAIGELASLGASRILSAKEPETVRAILCLLALGKGLRIHASFLHNYTGDELEDIKAQAGY